MAEVSQININNLERKVDSLSQLTNEVRKDVAAVNSNVNKVQTDLAKLQQDFEKMVADQKKTAALQQASTELVRVRQEIEHNFGNYKVVRETMLGVLQATDLALVKKTTISRVSEELMLSTPKYWLAPCLVAVSAWIGNDKDLAERAIAEAVRRDEERTALTMALICRRNNKVQTCYEWLSIYFAKQDAANFSEGTFTYIDAYVNGIFGPDDKHMCDDYITKWINEIRGSNASFEKNQEDMWKGYCDKFHNGIEAQCPELKETVQEYDRIDAYVGRINAVDAIAENFTGIAHAYVDQNRLKASIDKNLITLISRYDEEELPLRKEEVLLQTIKKYEGDKEAAKREVEEQERSRQVRVLNLVEQMTHVITAEGDVSPSEKKTAVSFLSGYIKKGFNTYITENKAQFPESITMNIFGWIGKTTDGANAQELHNDYDRFMNQRCNEEVAKAANNSPKNFMIGAILLGIIGVIGLVISPIVGVAGLIGAIVCVFGSNGAKKSIQKNIAAINEKYANMSIQGKQRIDNCINQWNDTRKVAASFGTEPIRDIIA